MLSVCHLKTIFLHCKKRRQIIKKAIVGLNNTISPIFQEIISMATLHNNNGEAFCFLELIRIQMKFVTLQIFIKVNPINDIQ